MKFDNGAPTQGTVLGLGAGDAYTTISQDLFGPTCCGLVGPTYPTVSTAANTTYTDPDHANTPYLISAGWAAGEPTYHRTHLTITDNLGLGVMHEGQYPQSGAPAWPTTQYGPIPQSDCPQDAVDTTDDICHTDCVAIEDANYYTISNNQFYSCQSQGLFLEFDSVGGAGGNGTIPVNNYIDSTNACGICIGGYANNALFGTNLIAFNTVNTGVGVTSWATPIETNRGRPSTSWATTHRSACSTAATQEAVANRSQTSHQPSTTMYFSEPTHRVLPTVMP